MSLRRPAAGLVLGGLMLSSAGIALLPGAAQAAPPNDDPAGNNGVIKIENHGDIDDIPENNPHQGCKFDIEWYNFDEKDPETGEAIVSTVSFESHAPTADATLTVDGPLEVTLEQDAAGGGRDLDARETYTLDADGVAHPKQGFHVKVTVQTPGSIGNDTKTKVFWFEDCLVPPDNPTSTPTPTPSPSETPTENPSETPTEPSSSSDESPGAVPTRIAAGTSSVSATTPTDSVSSNVGPWAVGLGGLIAVVGAVVTLARRFGAQHD